MERASAPSAGGLAVERLGLVRYAEAWARQEALRDERLAGRAPDTVLLLQHPDVITFGRGARERNTHLSDEALAAAGYEVFRVKRGGDVTWHGPGQLVGYPILDLTSRGADVHAYLRTLEQCLIGALAEFGIQARARPGYAGVWLDERRKIASIGVGVRRWITLHGFALNATCDLGRFDVILPCGLDGVEMVSMKSVLGRELALGEVRESVAGQLRKAFS